MHLPQSLCEILWTWMQTVLLISMQVCHCPHCGRRNFLPWVCGWEEAPSPNTAAGWGQQNHCGLSVLNQLLVLLKEEQTWLSSSGEVERWSLSSSEEVQTTGKEKFSLRTLAYVICEPRLFTLCQFKSCPTRGCVASSKCGRKGSAGCCRVYQCNKLKSAAVRACFLSLTAEGSESWSLSDLAGGRWGGKHCNLFQLLLWHQPLWITAPVHVYGNSQ